MGRNIGYSATSGTPGRSKQAENSNSTGSQFLLSPCSGRIRVSAYLISTPLARTTPPYTTTSISATSFFFVLAFLPLDKLFRHHVTINMRTQLSLGRNPPESNSSTGQDFTHQKDVRLRVCRSSSPPCQGSSCSRFHLRRPAYHQAKALIVPHSTHTPGQSPRLQNLPFAGRLHRH